MKFFPLAFFVASILCACYAFESHKEKSKIDPAGWEEILELDSSVPAFLKSDRSNRVVSEARFNFDREQRKKDELNQTMLLWIAGAAVFFIAGIFSLSKSKTP